MGLVLKDLEGLENNPQEYADRKAWIDRTMSNDVWANKIFKKVGILLTGHQANRPYMKACIETHAKLGLWITLAYDNYMDPAQSEYNHNSMMPGKETLDNVDMLIIPHHQVWGGVLYPWFWLLKFGAAAMSQFEYIYCTNSDFVLEKPEGFNELLDKMMLPDGSVADIMTSGPDYDEGPNYAANTAGFIVKSSALLKIVQHYQDHFIPWSVYEKYTNEIGNAEGRFGRAIKDLGLKKINVEAPNDDMLKVPGKGTWYDLLGFRHIHAEHNYAYRNQGIPPHYKYLDSRFMGDEFSVIKRYWDSGEDKEILKDWWAK